MANELRVRRNIDSLPFEELEAYKHAMRRVIEISKKDPESIDGYSYFEALHDVIDVGPCEHGRDTFLPWHRAHLLLFEDALRRSDPPKTSNVTIPYWDWSALPSGTRYPRDFEEPGSVLYVQGRESDRVCRIVGESGCYRVPFPRGYLDREVQSVEKWAGVDGFGGEAVGESDCRRHMRSGFGVLERFPHNDMHRLYIGGLMGDPNSAALDPIFWSFHAYIDLLWSQWQLQHKHPIDTCLECRLCGLWRDRAADERYRVKDVVFHEKQLGYRYEYVPGPIPPEFLREALPEDLPFDAVPFVDFAPSGHRDVQVLRELEVTIPAPGFSEAVLRFRGIKTQNPVSYGGDVYLLPRGVPFAPREVSFREKYLAGRYSIWQAHQHSETMTGHAHHDPEPVTSMEAVVNLTRAMRQLAPTHAGESWVVMVAITANTEGTLRDGTLERFALHAQPGLLPILDFDHVTLQVH